MSSSLPDSPARPFRRVTILGLAGIGILLAETLRIHQIDVALTGYEEDAAVQSASRSLDIFERLVTDADIAIAGADLVMICTPASQWEAMASAIRANGSAETMICVLPPTAAGSPERLRALLPDHLVATADRAQLGMRKDADSSTSLSRAKAGESPTPFLEFWNGLPEARDIGRQRQISALTMAAPHLIAHALLATAGELQGAKPADMLAHRAFHALALEAATTSTEFPSLADEDQQALLDILQRFSENLTALQRAIRWRHIDALTDLIDHSRSVARMSVLDDVTAFNLHSMDVQQAPSPLSNS